MFWGWICVIHFLNLACLPWLWREESSGVALSKVLREKRNTVSSTFYTHSSCSSELRMPESRSRWMREECLPVTRPGSPQRWNPVGTDPLAPCCWRAVLSCCLTSKVRLYYWFFYKLFPHLALFLCCPFVIIGVPSGIPVLPKEHPYRWQRSLWDINLSFYHTFLLKDLQNSVYFLSVLWKCIFSDAHCWYSELCSQWMCHWSVDCLPLCLKDHFSFLFFSVVVVSLR